MTDSGGLLHDFVSIARFFSAVASERRRSRGSRSRATHWCLRPRRVRLTRAGVTKFATYIKEQEKAVHILVNNSGISWGAEFADFPEKVSIEAAA